MGSYDNGELDDDARADHEGTSVPVPAYRQMPADWERPTNEKTTKVYVEEMSFMGSRRYFCMLVR